MVIFHLFLIVTKVFFLAVRDEVRVDALMEKNVCMINLEKIPKNLLFFNFLIIF
jgi:hypothetical protein